MSSLQKKCMNRFQPSCAHILHTETDILEILACRNNINLSKVTRYLAKGSLRCCFSPTWRNNPLMQIKDLLTTGSWDIYLSLEYGGAWTHYWLKLRVRFATTPMARIRSLNCLVLAREIFFSVNGCIWVPTSGAVVPMVYMGSLIKGYRSIIVLGIALNCGHVWPYRCDSASSSDHNSFIFMGKLEDGFGF